MMRLEVELGELDTSDGGMKVCGSQFGRQDAMRTLSL
jgi:hypothetical protein